MNIAHKSTMNCPVCNSAEVEPFFEMNDIPVHCNILLESKEQAVNAPRGDMNLGFCHSCGHLYNYAFDPSLMVYTEAYENSLHFSPRFQQFAESLAEDLIKQHELRNKDIIEIGCGKGDFLKLICDLGENRGYGFDASFEPELLAAGAKERFVVIQDFYSEKYSQYNADFICCRHVLEHIQHPNSFINDVRIAIGARQHAVVYFEVPNALWTLEDLGIWDLIYEHCSYFTSHSLAHVFQRNGFTVRRLREHYQRQFLGIELTLMNGKAEWRPDRTVASLADSVKTFGENYIAKVERWKKNFDSFAKEKKKVVVWGGGSKGITFLNVMKPFSMVEYMVDINPRKQGMFVAGAGQQVVGPDRLTEYQPDVVIIMNPIYSDEIREMLRASGVQADILVA